MAKVTACLFHGTSISINDALSHRDDARKRGISDPHFECEECKKACETAEEWWSRSGSFRASRTRQELLAEPRSLMDV
jgi:hypothetical protein